MADTAIGVDIGSHSVKAVLLRRRGSRIQIVRAGRAKLEELEHIEESRRKQTKAAMIVRNLLRSTGIPLRPARIAVAGRKSIIRYTRVPPAPAWRLKMLIDYEIEGDTEGQSHDLAYDFRLLELPVAHLEFTVMMAMARNELVESYCEIMDEAGVPVDNVTLTPFPVFNTFVHSRGAAIEDDKTTLLVDVGAENLDVVVERNGRLFFARNISPAGRAFTEAVQDEFRLPFSKAEELKCSKGRLLLGGDASAGTDDETVASPSPEAPTQMAAAVSETASESDTPVADGLLITPDEPGPELSPRDADQTAQLSEAMLPVVGRLASAIQSSLMYCRAQTRMPELEADTMVLTGGGAKLPGLRQALSRRLGISAVPADPLKGFDLSPLRHDMREEVEANAEAYTTAIGLALSRLKSDAVDFSLLPKKIKARRRFLEKTVYLWVSGAAMVLTLVLLGYSSWHNTGRLRQHVGELKDAYEANEAGKSTKDKLALVNHVYRKEIMLMRDIQDSPRLSLAAFRALTNAVPDAVELTRFYTRPPKMAGKPDEVIVEGYVLKKVRMAGGDEEWIEPSKAHKIIAKLAQDLRDDPIFDRPPKEQVVQRAVSKEGTDHVAEFKLKLVFAKRGKS